MVVHAASYFSLLFSVLHAAVQAPEYHDFGQVSTRTDVYAFGVILLELLMGMPARQVVDMLFDDRDFFNRMGDYVDPRAGAWPKKVVTTLASVAKGCAEYRPRQRATVRTVLPRVKALQKLTQQ